LADVRGDRVVIVGVEPRRLTWPVVGTFLLGCVMVWMGLTGSLIYSVGIRAAVVRWFMVAGGTLFVVAMPLLIVSNVVQGWAVLVGTSPGLQLVYPFGLHRLARRSRLEGVLREAKLVVLRRTAGGRFQAPLTFVRITAPEGTLEFSFGTRAANTDFKERFAAWVATRQPA
jgi:hypothetical protein